MTHFRMPVKRQMTSGPCQETSYTAITSNPESNFTRQEKNHSLFHWNASTHTNLDVKQERRTMIIGISMGQEICLIHGQVSHNLLYWKKNLLKGIRGPGETDKKAANIQARLFCGQNSGRNWEEMPSWRRSKKWSHQKLHLDDARKLRGNYFIDPEDKELKETIKNARMPVSPAMPSKTSKNSQHGVTRGKSNKIKTKLACILEASESTRLRMGESLPNHREDHIAGKGNKSLQHYNLVHKFIPMSQAMEIPAAKAAVDKEWRQISAWNLTTVRSKKEVIDEVMTKGAKVHFASVVDICHLKNAELEAKHQKYKGRVVLRGDVVKDNSGSYAVFTEQGSSASQMTAAEIMDIISRLPWCAGQAADAVSAYTQVKVEDAPKLLKIPKSECPDIWIRLPRHKWPKSWSSIEDPVVPLERNLYGHPLAGLLWERQSVGRRFPHWECLFVHRVNRVILFCVCGWHKIGWKEKINPMWEVLNKEVDLGEPTSFLDHLYWGCTQRQCENKQRYWQLQNHVRIQNFRGVNLKTTILGNIRISSCSYDMQGHAKKCVERYCDLENKTTQQFNFTKYLLHASMTTTSKKKNWNL